MAMFPMVWSRPPTMHVNGRKVCMWMDARTIITIIFVSLLILILSLLFHFQALVLKLVPITTGLNEFARQGYSTNLWCHHHLLELASIRFDEFVN